METVIQIDEDQPEEAGGARQNEGRSWSFELGKQLLTLGNIVAGGLFIDLFRDNEVDEGKIIAIAVSVAILVTTYKMGIKYLKF